MHFSLTFSYAQITTYVLIHTHTPLLASPQNYSLLAYSHLPNFERGALQKDFFMLSLAIT